MSRYDLAKLAKLKMGWSRLVHVGPMISNNSYLICGTGIPQVYDRFELEHISINLYKLTWEKDLINDEIL